MNEWHATFPDDLWLKPDSVGAEEAAFIKRALRLRRGQAVLDAPCGAGRVAIHLARAGCLVTGVDIRRAFTKRAAGRFRKEGRAGRFVVMDLRRMDFSSEFHGIYNWSGSFGYFPDSENLDVVKRCAAALRKGGRLLVDQPNRERVLRNFTPSRKMGDVTMAARWVADAERIESDWVLEKDGKTQRIRTSMRFYTPSQLRGLFEEAGLTVEASYGSIAAEQYGRSSRRLIMVGRKPG